MTLHHLIRESDRPYAEEIGRFDRHFEKCLREPRKYTVTSEALKDYRKLLTWATMAELAEYEVVLATCSVGGCRKLVEGTKNTVFQVRTGPLNLVTIGSLGDMSDESLEILFQYFLREDIVSNSSSSSSSSIP